MSAEVPRIEAAAEVGRSVVRDVTDLVVPAAGGVVPGDANVGVRLVDAAGVEVVSVSAFLRDLRAWDRSCSSLRSYALALLRWFRFLWAVEVDWDRVTRWEVTEFVLLLQQTREVRPSRVASGPAAGSVNPVTRKRYLPEGYQPRTINHNLSVLRVFYDFHVDAGTGPLVNPVPVARRRDGQRVHAHHNPMEPFAPHRRAPGRQRVPAGLPRSVPDGLFDELFAAMTCDRDRAAVAFYISTGARAGELLGVSCDRLDVGNSGSAWCVKAAASCSGCRPRATRSCGCGSIRSGSPMTFPAARARRCGGPAAARGGR